MGAMLSLFFLYQITHQTAYCAVLLCNQKKLTVYMVKYVFVKSGNCAL